MFDRRESTPSGWDYRLSGNRECARLVLQRGVKAEVAFGQHPYREDVLVIVESRRELSEQ